MPWAGAPIPAERLAVDQIRIGTDQVATLRNSDCLFSIFESGSFVQFVHCIVHCTYIVHCTCIVPKHVHSTVLIIFALLKAVIFPSQIYSFFAVARATPHAR